MEKLLRVLKKQQHTLNELIGISKQEQEAIMARNIELIKASIKQKNELQKQLIELEKERQALTDATNLSSLADTAAGDKKEVLEALRHSLKNSLQELKALNTTNTLLIKTELAYFDFLKEKVFPTIKQYDNKGNVSNKKQEDNTIVSHLA